MQKGDYSGLPQDTSALTIDTISITLTITPTSFICLFVCASEKVLICNDLKLTGTDIIHSYIINHKSSGRIPCTWFKYTLFSYKVHRKGLDAA